MFSTDELFEFLGELRQGGFDFSTEQYIAVHDLLLALAASGERPLAAKRLRTYLAPVICTSPREQEIFYDRFERWLASRPEPVAPPDETGEQEAEVSSPESDLQALARRLRPWKWMIAAAVILLGIAAAIFFLQPPPPVWQALHGKVVAPDGSGLAGATAAFLDSTVTADSAGHFSFRHLQKKDSSAQLRVTHPGFIPHQRPVALDRSDTSRLVIRLDSLKKETGTEPVVTTPISQEQKPRSQLQSLVERINRFADTVEAEQQPRGWARVYRDYFDWIHAGAACLPWLILGFWWWWQLYRGRLLLEKQSTTAPPELQKLLVKGASDELFRGPAFRRTAQQLRRHREVASSELDAPATVGATIGKGGWFTPVYLGRQVLPEYLLLIDRATFQDQQARRVDELVARLQEHGVFVDRYYFDSDPRICRRADLNAPLLTLEELAARHPEHRLLIFSDGAGFMHPLSNRPQRWLEQFSAWGERALLTPEFPNHWGYREIALAGWDFVVLPATQAGLTVLVEAMQKNTPPSIAPQNGAAAFPAMLRERPRLYLERLEPEPAAVERLCRQLQDYLGREGYAWLSACAVYPLLTWDLTIYLGYCLKDGAGEKLISEERLLKLARLPWLRFGSMPDWLRLRLIAGLAREPERAIRQALENLLKSALAQPEAGFVLDIARPAAILKRRDWRRLLRDFLRTTPEDSALRDYVFLSFMAGRKPRKLTVNLPDLLRRVLFRGGQVLFGLRPAAALALAFAVSLGAWEFIPSPSAPLPRAIPHFRLDLVESARLEGHSSRARSDLAWSDYAASLPQYPRAFDANASGANTFAANWEWWVSYRTWLADTLSSAVDFDSTVFEFEVETELDSVKSNLAQLKRAPLYLVLRPNTIELTVTVQTLAGEKLPALPLSGAEVIINGIRRDTTNAAGQLFYSFRADTSELRVKIQKSGVKFVESEKIVALVDNQQKYTVAFDAETPAETYGIIRLTSLLTGQVFIDGKVVGEVDSGVVKEFSAAEGKHRVMVRGAADTETVFTSVLPGEIVLITLRPKEMREVSSPPVVDTTRADSINADTVEVGLGRRRADEVSPESTVVPTPPASSPILLLRSTPATLSNEQVQAMLVEKGFYDKYRNPGGKGISHQYRRITQNGEQLVIDDATGLTWQQAGSSENMVYEDAKKYIEKLNREKFAGYGDWRLPTLEEAMSLMEPDKVGLYIDPEKNKDGLYIDLVFDKELSWIWTADQASASDAWVVNFYGYGGSCFMDPVGYFGRYVRAVRFGQLRSVATTLSVDQVKAMLVAKGFYDLTRNPGGKGISHQYRRITQNDEPLVVDDATGLMWQQAGSAEYMVYEDAKKYIEKLNREKFAGYSDWRLPTLEEAMSLMEPGKNKEGLYIDPVFDKEKRWIWTADQSSASVAWVVNFTNGYCNDLRVGTDAIYVRAVRFGH